MPALATPLPARRVQLDGVPLCLRGIAAADLELERAFVQRLSPRSRYLRLLSGRMLSDEELRRFTAIDPAREVALVALAPAAGGERMVGVARSVDVEPAGHAEFAIVLADDWQGRGLGHLLVRDLIEAARAHGTRRLVGVALAENAAMLRLARKLGFQLRRDPASGQLIQLALDLA